jgi:hypothetical protein
MTETDSAADARHVQAEISDAAEKAELARDLLATVRAAYWQHPLASRREMIGIARRRLVVRS